MEHIKPNEDSTTTSNNSSTKQQSSKDQNFKQRWFKSIGQIKK